MDTIAHAASLSPLFVPLRTAVEQWGGHIESLDDWSDQIVRIYPPNEEERATGGCLIGCGAVATFPLNSAVASAIARDKSHTAEILSRAGYRVPRGGHVFLSGRRSDERPAGKERSDATGLAKSLGYPIVCKPLTGSKGEGVCVCHNATDLKAALETLSTHHDAARIETLIEGDEYRLFVSCGRVEFMYRKSRLTLRGDGHQSLLKLTLAETALTEHQATTLLRQAGQDPKAILPEGAATVPLAAANLAQGSTIDELETDIPPTLADWALTAADALDLKVCGLDVLASGDPKTVPCSDMTILEANANPSLLGIWDMGETELAIQIWTRIFERIFAGQAEAITRL